MNAARAVERLTTYDADVFLSKLGHTFTFQTFAESTAPNRQCAKILQGTLSDNRRRLHQLNDMGAGVFVMVNEGDGLGRKTANVTAVRALFLDLDGSPLAPVLDASLRPHMVVESSPHRWHTYWRLAGLPIERFKPLQQALALRFGGDPKVCDLPRVMRLPGFFHMKGEPFLTSLVHTHDSAPYREDELIDALELVVDMARSPRSSKPSGRRIGKGERNSTLFDLGCGLSRRGYDFEGISVRLQKINAGRCDPPLTASEIEAVSLSAAAQRSDGFAQLPHELLDSLEWKSLSPDAVVIVVAFFRRYNGSNNGALAVTLSDFSGRHGLKRKRFYRALSHAVDSGILIQTAPCRLTQHGAIPALYAIAEWFLCVPA